MCLLSLFLFIAAAGGAVWLSDGWKWSDQKKLEKIFMNTGLFIKEGKVIKKMKLYRKTLYDWGTEYAYKIPLGLSFPDIERNIHAIQDGINNKIKGQQKTIELDYDGMLRVRIYEKQLPILFEFELDFIKLNKHVPIGIDASKNIIEYDYERSHLLVAGTSRYGKSELIKLIITSLMVKFDEHIKITLIDLKGGVELNMFRHCKQVVNFASDEFEAETSLKKVVDDMKKIQKQLLEKDIRHFTELGNDMHFVFVDEGAELSPTNETGDSKKAKQRCQKYMSEIARLGLSLGFKIIYATQYPLRENLSPQLKQNADTKICFRLQNQRASEVVIDEGGAEKLPHKLPGRAILYTDKKTIIQTFFMPYPLMMELIEPYKVVKEVEHHPVTRKEDRGNIIEFR